MVAWDKGTQGSFFRFLGKTSSQETEWTELQGGFPQAPPGAEWAEPREGRSRVRPQLAPPPGRRKRAQPSPPRLGRDPEGARARTARWESARAAAILSYRLLFVGGFFRPACRPERLATVVSPTLSSVGAGAGGSSRSREAP